MVVSASACGAPGPVDTPAAVIPFAPDPARIACETAAKQRARVPALLASGKLDRTVRVIAKANELCQASARDTWEVEVATLAELGRFDDAKRVLDAIESSADATPTARAVARRARATAPDGRDGRAILKEGLEAEKRGDAASAQRAFDQAKVAIERETGLKVVVDAPVEFPAAVTSVGWSHDGKTIAAASGAFVSVRDATVGFGEIARLTGGGGTVKTLAFSPDDKALATGSTDNIVRIWDLARGTATKLAGHRDEVNAVAYSPDGATLASGSADRSVRLWDSATKSEKRTLTDLTEAVESVAFSPDGATLAASAGMKFVDIVVEGQEGPSVKPATLVVFEVASGKATRKLDHRAWSLLFLDQKTLLAGGLYGEIAHLDFKSGRIIRKNIVKGVWFEKVNFLAPSPDKHLIATSPDVTEVVLYDLQKRSERRFVGHQKDVTGAAFSPDGKRLVSGADDGTVRIWDTETGQTVEQLPARIEADFISPIAYSRDKRWLATADGEGGVRVWALSPGGVTRRYETPVKQHPARRMSFSADGKVLAALFNFTDLLVIDVERGTSRRLFPDNRENFGSVAVSPNGKKIAVVTKKEWRLVDAATGTVDKTVEVPGGRITEVDYAPDGKTLVTGGDDGAVRIWDVSLGIEVRKMEHAKGVFQVTFSADGAWVASRSSDRTARLWNAATGAEVNRFVGHDGAPYSLALSADGRTIATSSSDKKIIFWNTANGERRRTMQAVRTPYALVFAPGGATLASASDDGVVHFLSSEGEPRGELFASSGKNFGYVLSAETLVEMLGPDADGSPVGFCRAGAWSFPFALCRERAETKGLLAFVALGDAPPAGP